VPRGCHRGPPGRAAARIRAGDAPPPPGRRSGPPGAAGGHRTVNLPPCRRTPLTSAKAEVPAGFQQPAGPLSAW